MNQRAPSWELYAVFLAVMRTGSLSAAARALRTTQPTVRRQIEMLEQGLGAVLFTRAPSGLIPTDLALRALPHAEDIAATAEALLRVTSGAGDTATGTVRLTASEIVACEILPPLLADLLRDHPGLAIELVASNATEDLPRRDADIAVRMIRPRQQALVARALPPVEIGLHATETYLARHGTPSCLADLAAGHILIGEDRDRAIAEALHALGLPPLPFAFRTDCHLAQLRAITAGLGIGFCQTVFARPGAGLVRLLPEIGTRLQVWLVMHEDLRAVPRVRLVYDTLAERLPLALRGPS